MRKIYDKSVQLVAKNPKTAFWSIVSIVISAFTSALVYKFKKKQDTKSNLLKEIESGEIAIRKKRVDTECDILKTAANTACKMMEHTTSIVPDIKSLKEELKATKEELASVKEESKMASKAVLTNEASFSVEGNNYQGRSSACLFNRQKCSSKWVVDGYMKIGQLSFIVAGGGVGKSNLATMIAIAASKGNCPEFLPPQCKSSEKLPVFYYRLEDFDDELHGKYGQGKIFAGCDIVWYLPEDLPLSNLSSFVEHLNRVAGMLTEDALVIIDPATKLTGYTHEKFVNGVEEAMKIAKDKGYVLTVIASIHLDEINNWKPLTLGDIKGGDKAFQLAGSVIALRKERTSDCHRFIQCLKEPKGSPKPFGGQVLVCQSLEKELDENNRYLHYQYVELKDEAYACPMKPKVQKDDVATMEQKKRSKRAPNQKLTPEAVSFIKICHTDGKKKKEILNELQRSFGLSVSERTISRTINN